VRRDAKGNEIKQQLAEATLAPKGFTHQIAGTVSDNWSSTTLLVTGSGSTPQPNSGEHEQRVKSVLKYGSDNSPPCRRCHTRLVPVVQRELALLINRLLMYSGAEF
jgi:hypothetical protein